MFAICPLSSIPVRALPSNSAEMTTQILFGEVVEVIKTVRRLDALNAGWTNIRCQWDGYMGWVTTKQLQMLDKTFELTSEGAICYEIMSPCMNGEYSIPITMGATLPYFDGISFKIGTQQYTYSGQAIYPNRLSANSTLLLKIARRYLYAPYLWGGRSPFGIDCSGLAQICYKMIGINLPRDASQQAEIGETIDFITETQAGDLAYFESPAGRITHVGILMGDGNIIHASGQVRINKIDHYGIYNAQLKKYSHTLRVIKRVLSKEELIETQVISKEESTETIANQILMF